MWRTFSMTSIFLVAAVNLAAQTRPVDVGASRVTIYAYRAGLFSRLADNHEIEAPVAEGSIDQVSRWIKLRFDARRMRVVDPKLGTGKREQVQERMAGPDVLDVNRFPDITFDSTSIVDEADGTLRVQGTLHLHGHVHEVTGMASRTGAGFSGHFTISQHDFGIKPVSVAGGTVRVKDELSVEFQIRPAGER